MSNRTGQDGNSAHVVGAAGDVSEGSPLVADVEGTTVAVFFHNGEYFAINNVCPHQGGPLGDGKVTDKCVHCPWHGWQFDLETGQHVHGSDAVETYPVTVEDSKIRVEL